MRPRIQAAARLLQLLSLLSERRFWTGADLAEALGITGRSVRRDVDQLRELGFPVHATPGVGGGYALGAGAELPPLPLDDDEATAVAIGLRAAATGPIAGVEGAAVRALAKLEQVLPARLRRRLDTLQAVSVGLGPSGPRLDGGLLSTVAHACRAERQLAFGYRSADGRSTERRVEPYRLVHTDTRWYLLAWDLKRGDWRTFRVDRIQPDPRPGAPFRARPLPDEDVAAWVSRAVSHHHAYRYRAEVLVHAAADDVRRRIPPAYGDIEARGPDRCVLRTGGDDLHWMAFYIGVSGFDVEVIEPPEFAEHFAAWADRFARAARCRSADVGSD